MSGPSSGGGGSSFSVLDKVDLGGDDGGCVFFLLALALIAAGVAASLYVVYAAPTLLAEIIVDSLLISGLYKSMKNAGRGDWIGAVVRRTWVPVLLTLILFTTAGYFLQRAAPRARTLAESWQAVKEGK